MENQLRNVFRSTGQLGILGFGQFNFDAARIFWYDLSMSLNLKNELIKNPFVLAPMAGITDSPFRSFMREMGCGPVISELISADGIEHASGRTFKMMKYQESERPVAIQLFGDQPERVAKAAQQVEKLGVDWVDLNFGCPVPKVVSRGAGSAILKDLVALGKMVGTVKKAISIPLTIKIRTGWDEKSRNATDVVNVAASEGASWVAIHGRTRAQGYSGQSDWDYIGEVKAKTNLPIIGNGDIHTASQAIQRLNTFGLDGVMIGRGCLKNPWIFQEAVHLRNHGEQLNVNKDFRFVFYKLKSYLDGHCDDKIMMIQLKKFSSWFSAGYPGASVFRKNLFAAQNVEELLSIIEGYFEALRLVQQADTSHESFLMGGHG